MEVKTLENEGHVLVFERALKDSIEYFKIHETYNDKKHETSIMTLDGGYLYMDKLIARGYVPWN